MSSAVRTIVAGGAGTVDEAFFSAPGARMIFNPVSWVSKVLLKEISTEEAPAAAQVGSQWHPYIHRLRRVRRRNVERRTG